MHSNNMQKNATKILTSLTASYSIVCVVYTYACAQAKTCLKVLARNNVSLYKNKGCQLFSAFPIYPHPYISQSILFAIAYSRTSIKCTVYEESLQAVCLPNHDT